MTESAPLPGILADLARAKGDAAALRLAEAFGGTQLYVPPEIAPDHPIARAIGPQAAKWLAGERPGERIEVPLGPATNAARQREAIRRLLRQGLSERQIALRLKCHMRTVRRQRAAMGVQADPRQLDLLARVG